MQQAVRRSVERDELRIVYCFEKMDPVGNSETRCKAAQILCISAESLDEHEACVRPVATGFGKDAQGAFMVLVGNVLPRFAARLANPARQAVRRRWRQAGTLLPRRAEQRAPGRQDLGPNEAIPACSPR